MAIDLKKSSDVKKNLAAEMKKIQDEMKAIDDEEAIEAEEAAKLKAIDLEIKDLEARESKLKTLQKKEALLEQEEAEAEEERIRESEAEQSQGLALQPEIDLNKEVVTKEENMVEKDSKEAIKALKVQEKALIKEGKQLSLEAKKAAKKALKEAKEDEAEERRQAKIPKIKVTVGEKSYMIPEGAIYELSKKNYKIKEDRKKIKEGEVCILYLLESGVADIRYVKPDNGMFIVEGMYYHVVEACNYSLGPKRIPLAVIPEWSFSPVSRQNYWEKLGGVFATAQKLIIKSLESAEIVKIKQENEPAKKADGKLVIGIIIAAIVALYLFSKSTGGA